jgi:hypothetical protein
MPSYVERMIEGLAAVLARIAARRKSGNLDDAEAELAETFRRISGVTPELLDAVGAEAVAAQLTNPEQILALFDLCSERAEIAAARGDSASAERWRRHAEVLRGQAGRPTTGAS